MNLATLCAWASEPHPDATGTATRAAALAYKAGAQFASNHIINSL